MYLGVKSKEKLKIVRNFNLWIFVLIVTVATAVAGAGQEPGNRGDGGLADAPDGHAASIRR